MPKLPRRFRLIHKKQDAQHPAEGRLGRSLSVANALALIGQCLGASNLLEAYVRIVSALKPIESPVATGLQLLGEVVAFRA